MAGCQETTSRKDVALRGVAIDRELAVHESSVRQLESGSASRRVRRWMNLSGFQSHDEDEHGRDTDGER